MRVPLIPGPYDCISLPARGSLPQWYADCESADLNSRVSQGTQPGISGMELEGHLQCRHPWKFLIKAVCVLAGLARFGQQVSVTHKDTGDTPSYRGVTSGARAGARSVLVFVCSEQGLSLHVKEHSDTGKEGQAGKGSEGAAHLPKIKAM